jgi:hypothetical protein
MSYHSFIDSNGKDYGSFETIYMGCHNLLNDGWIDGREDDKGNGYLVWTLDDFDENVVDNIEDYVGWYWVAGFPGCLWDGTPEGPYLSEDEAIKAARA